jgi:hypothetical protein
VSLAHVLATGLIAAGLTGCTLLDLLVGVGPFDPDGSLPPFPFASAPPAAYTGGRASLILTSGVVDPSAPPVVLDELAVATSEADFGTHVVWENEDGWYLSFTGISGFGSDLGSYLSIDRINDHEHWVIVDPTRCLTTTTQQDAGGLVGSATCKGARWADFFSLYTTSGFPQPLAEQPPFDAEITFEAH